MSNQPTFTSRHVITWGEALDFDAPADAASYQLWSRESPTPAARWISQGGYDIAGDVVIAAPAAALVPAMFESGGFTVGWPALDTLAQAGEREALQVISYLAGGGAFRVDRYAVPTIDAGSPDVIVGQEREILALLIEQRKESAETSGITELTLPDGRQEKYADLGVIDRRIAEVRARIAWYEAAARGQSVPGLTLW